MKIKLPILSVILYVLAAILLIYSIWGAVHTYNFLSELIQQNQLIFQGNEYDIVSFVMNNVGQYIVYTATLFALGWIYHNNLLNQEQEIEEDNQVENEEMINLDPEE